MILTSGRGADFGEYSRWAEYFTEFDLSLWDEYSKSINGKPLIQWQYGVGLIGAIPTNYLELKHLSKDSLTQLITFQ